MDQPAAQGPEPPVAACHQLTRRHATANGTLEVLCELDLEVRRGTWLNVSGASGAGKTTLLHLMATLDRPDAGRVCIEGQDVSRLGGDALAVLRRRCIGIIYQDAALIARFAVWQNVSLGLVPEGVPHRQRRDRSAAILESLGLQGRIDEKAGRLSGGEIQRVAIARALIGDPRLLIADEPTSQVDQVTQSTILTLLQERRAHGLAILSASHSAELSALADDNRQLVGGRLQAGTWAAGEGRT